MLSIISSLATSKFNQLSLIEQMNGNCASKDIIENMRLVQFDCKVWDAKEYNNVFAHYLWRQTDCVRNSKQQTAQTYLPHKKLFGRTADEGIRMLKDEMGIDWNAFDNGKKYGRFIYKEEADIEPPGGKVYKRNKWKAHDAFPFIEMNKIPIKYSVEK